MARKPIDPPDGHQTFLRIRLPSDLKRWLAHEAVDAGLSQQGMALAIIEAAKELAVSRKVKFR